MNVYDFDKTIYDGDSTFDFYIFCLKRNKKIIKLIPNLIYAYSKYYIFKKGNKTQMKEKMYRFLTYIDTEQEVKEFWKIHCQKIKKWYYKTQKSDDLVISASPYFLLKPICTKLKIKHLIASDVSPVDGKYSGINCHGKEKVRLFNLKFDENIDDFYSDSYSDTPLAEISKNAYMVKKNNIYPWKFK